jgi:hypothetical protein
LVIVGATPEGKKEFVGLADGVRESTQSWKEMFLDLRRRGLTIGPELAVADGALGFWKALDEVWPKTRGQRCWVHKTANVLNKLPKSQQARAKSALEEIWMAETKKDALVAFDAFIEIYAIKYEKAVECLTKGREALLAFYDFPAEHRKHLRTSNPVESTFATVRHRMIRSNGCLSNKTALAMVFKLAQAAEKHWRRLDGKSQLPKVVLGVKFTDGIEVAKEQVQTAAGPRSSPKFDHSSLAGDALMKIQTIEDFARAQDLAALRGVMSRLVTRFPENGEIFDLVKAEYRAGRPLPAVEEAVAARIETGEVLPHTLSKAQRDHLRKIRSG